MQDGILGLLNPIMSGIFAATFVALWWRSRKDVHVLGIALGCLGLGLGFLVFHYASNPGAIGPSLLMHAIYSTSVISLAWAATKRVGQSIYLPGYIGASIVAAVLIAFACLANNESARLYAANGYYGLVFVVAAQSMARAARKEWIDRVIIGLYVVTALQFYVRPMTAVIVNGNVDAIGYRESAFYSVLVVTVAVLSLLFAMAFVCAVVLDQMRSFRDETETDMLTGLQLRRAFETTAMDLLDESVTESTPICMIVADIDHFKQVNDLWGHQAGDKAIATFGRLLDRSIRDSDISGRIGGEEFCVIVRDCKLEQARKLAERIRTAFSEMRHEGVGENISLTASFGIAACQPGEGYGRLFGRADAALYHAKQSGRNQVITEDQAHTSFNSRSGKDRRSAAA